MSRLLIHHVLRALGLGRFGRFPGDSRQTGPEKSESAP